MTRKTRIWNILQTVNTVNRDPRGSRTTLVTSGDTEPAARASGPLWATLLATFFGIGRLRPGPGTWASAATVVLWWAIARGIDAERPYWVAIVLAGVVILVGIPASTRVARASRSADPSFVVIDEVAGQLIALITLPLSWKSLLAGFILFRAFDIVKPPPLRHLERIPAGAGIMLDDVGAGLYALVVARLLIHLGWLR